MLYDIILSIKISIIMAIIKIIHYLYINMIINYKYSKSLFLYIINDILILDLFLLNYVNMILISFKMKYLMI